MKINIYSTKNVLRGIGLAAVLAIFGSSAQAQLLTQAFTTSSAPSGWTLSNTCSSSSSNANWKFSTSGMGYGASGATDHTMGGGTYFAWVDGSSPYPCMCSMTTSNISATLGAGLELSFWIYSNNTNDPGNNTLTVDYYDGATWHNAVYSFAGNNPGWFQAVVGLGANPVAGTGNVKLRFNVNKNSAYTSFYNDIAIDDVSLIELLPCSNPPAGGTINASTTSACTAETINFALNGVINAQGLTRQWQDSTASGSWQDITGATSAMYSTTISQPTYFRCKSVCSGGTPAYSDTILINQAPFYTCYCSAGATSTTYGYIGDFEFSNVSYTSPVGCGQQYTDNTAMVANVFQGNTYNLSAYVNSCTGTYAYNTGFKVWIDYNQNGVYTDPGEEVIAQNLTYFQTHGGNITIPATSLTGNTGMRVMVVEGGSLSAMTPCYSYTWGEVEDYTINIQLPPADDAGVAAINSPSFPTCIIDSTICVTLQNLGSDTLNSATISYSINGGSYTTYSWTGTILPQSVDTVCVTIGNVNFQTGDDLTVVANNPNGNSSAIYTANDTMSITNMNVSLNGTYTIPSDFTSINAAIDALNAYGVCDHVIFNLASGTYNEHMPLGEIMGAGPDATIKFQSASGDTADVFVQFNGNIDTTSVVYLNGADWFRFKNITFENTSTTYGHVFRIENGADHNIIDSNRIVTTVATTTSANRAAIYSSGGTDNDNTISYNTIENGSFGIYVRGVSNTNTGLEVGLDVNNNHIMNPYYMGTYFYYHQGLNFSENEVSSNSAYSYGYGSYFGYCVGGFEISRNHILASTNSNWPYYGMYNVYCDGNSSALGIIANNIINSKGYVGLYQYYSDTLLVAHNTVNIVGGTSTTSRAYYGYYSNNYSTQNNLFSNFGAGQAAGFYSGNPTEVSNNAYYSTGTNKFYVNGSYQTSYSAFQTAFVLDTNSLYTNPDFSDVQAGITCKDSLAASGLALSQVTVDFDSLIRSNTPSIGAREIQVLNNFTLGPNDTICGNEVTLSPNSSGGTIAWTNGNGVSLGSGASLVVDTNSVQPIIASFSGLCGTVIDSIDLTFVPNIQLDNQVYFCAGDTAQVAPIAGLSSGASYNWFPGSINTPQISITSSGYYILTKTQAGCVSHDTIQAVQYNPVVISTTMNSGVSCNGGNNGSVSASATGGTSPYSFLWNNGSNQTTINSLTAGTYYVTATDINGCTGTGSVTVSSASSLLNNISVIANVSCFGGNDGALLSNASGGTSPYSYAWSNGVSSATNSNLIAGSYSATITDANGCVANASATVSQPDSISMSTSGTNLLCFNDNSGAASVAATGGTGSISFAWSNGQSGASISAIAAGTYTVTATDANGCANDQAIVITEPALLAASLLNADSTLCFGSADGSAEVTTSGGTSPYSYAWSNGASTALSTNMAAGNYMVTVTDANGCDSMLSINIFQPDSISLSVSGSDLLCFDDNTGMAAASAFGGTGSVAFTWDNGSTQDSITSLAAGNYTVTATDINGCLASMSITISQPDLITLSLNSTNAVCSYDSNGAISTSYAGGTMPFDFAWSNGATDSLIQNLAVGSYYLTLTDANGCQVSDSTVIDFTSASIALDMPQEAIICLPFTITLESGVEATSYLWSTGDTTSSIEVNAGGNYVLVVGNQDGCLSSDTTNVIEQPCTGMEQLNQTAAVALYPNPNRGVFNVEINNAKTSTIEFEFFGLDGSLISSGVIHTENGQAFRSFDFKNISQGVYIMQLHSDNFAVTKRIVIE